MMDYILDSGKLNQYFCRTAYGFYILLLRISWDIFKCIFKHCSVEILTNCADFSESRSRIYVSAYWCVYCKSIGGVLKAAGVFSIRFPKAAWYWRVPLSRILLWKFFQPRRLTKMVFALLTGLLKPGKSSLYRLLVRIRIILVFS